MKLKEFLDKINEIVKERPEILELKVVTAKDDEGNGFNEIHYNPSLGKFSDRDFREDKENPDSICVN